MKRLLLLTVFVAFGGSCDRSEPEVHLIPSGYVGTIYIVHNRSDGTPLKREGRARLYEIPADGVLWSQSSTNLGWARPTDFKYYYVGADGKRQPLTSWVRASDANVPDDVVAVYGGSNGVACQVEFDEYYVGTKTSMKSESYREKDLTPYLKAHGLCQ